MTDSQYGGHVTNLTPGSECNPACVVNAAPFCVCTTVRFPLRTTLRLVRKNFSIPAAASEPIFLLLPLPLAPPSPPCPPLSPLTPPVSSHMLLSADAACCRATSAVVPPLMSRAHFGSLGLYRAVWCRHAHAHAHK
jgi:hypothetical protein